MLPADRGILEDYPIEQYIRDQRSTRCTKERRISRRSTCCCAKSHAMGGQLLRELLAEAQATIASEEGGPISPMPGQPLERRWKTFGAC